MKFVIARLTAEDRWASDGRRAARAGVEKGSLTMRGECKTAPEGSAVGGVGGSEEVDAGEEGAGGDSRAAGLQGCREAGMGRDEVGRATGDGRGGDESGADGGGGAGHGEGVGAGGGVSGEGGGGRGGRDEGGRGSGPGGEEGAGERGGAAAAGMARG